jgi:hypothetical protein
MATGKSTFCRWPVANFVACRLEGNTSGKCSGPGSNRRPPAYKAHLGRSHLRSNDFDQVWVAAQALIAGADDLSLS